MSKKTILLTGGSGFIGKNIKESFLVTNYNLLAPTSVELNLIDTISVDNYFNRNHIDVVIHSAVKPSHRNAKEFQNLLHFNTRMFFNLERHSDKYEKMLVIGSGAIYDNRNYHPKMKEDDYIQNIPIDDHGYCKYICEKVIEHSSNIFDLRVFGIFGKYEDYAIRFISNAICKTLFDLPITIKQNRKFDYIYIDNLIQVIDWFIKNKPQYRSYNITPDKSISLYEIASLVKKISKKELPIVVNQEGLGLEYSGDNTRMKKEITMINLTTFEDAVLQLYNWYNSNLDKINKDVLLIDK